MTGGSRGPRSRVPAVVAAGLVGGLLALAAVFLRNARAGTPRRGPARGLEARLSASSTVRTVPSEMTFGGTPCGSCHEGKEPLQGNPRKRGVFHDAIRLQHGRNEYCFNCHHRLQPADFSNFDGSPIALADVQLLCSRCHGPTYRDWIQGAHGRRTGWWDKAKGGPKYTVCIACHDPHWPVFKPLTASPPPRVNPRDPMEDP